MEPIRSVTITGPLAATGPDSMVLSSDGTYQYDGGDQLCGAEDDASAKVGAWEFNAENAVMTFDPGTESEVSVNIITLDDIRLSYFRAVLNPVVAPYLLQELKALDSGSPTIQAYIGATQALLAVLTNNPFAQIKHLRKSVTL